MDGYDLQAREIAILKGVELSLCVVTEEAEVRVVHVAGWASWINTGEAVVKAEWEAYIRNVATRTYACRIISSHYVGYEEKKN